ncbi:HNH endonuclease [Brevibacillus brevis]|uniref:HNH endonuclease n=1 Tax=Brevibacillus brevis TaxID=1393 RepID=A0A2Z4MKE1_BREBE|nr:HNH endonuclease signature motif containing protein [Brevibacillus brevis]AWX56930.1 HNH endonuclease [Brevibacillus brevis]
MDLSLKFHKALLDTCQKTRRETTYNPSGLSQRLASENGVVVAKTLLRGKDQSGLARLLLEGRLDLSMEALMLDKEYKDLFTDEERDIARQRLIECKYTFPAEAEMEMEENVAENPIESTPIDVTSIFVPGAEFRRLDLHTLFAGQSYGRISTSSRFPFIMLFTGERGEEYGYKDGWNEEGIFLYTGEGQEGDMQFIKGNKAIIEHVDDGKDVHLFEYIRTGHVRYIGQMICIGYKVRDKDNKGQDRKVIVFELMPIEVVNNSEIVGATELSDLSLEELKNKALVITNHGQGTTLKERIVQYRERSRAVKLYALKRANGVCEACGNEAPFINTKGEPFLEVHHTRRLSDGGPDHPEWVAAICPNCHRRTHYGYDAVSYNDKIIKKIIETELRIGAK